MKFQKCPKTFLEVSKHVLWWFFRVFSVQCTLEGREVEKIQKNWKKFKLSKSRKRFQKCPILFRGDFFRIFLDKCTLKTKTCKKSKKTQRIFEFSKESKNVPKSVQTSFELVWRLFYWQKMPSAPWRVETWINFKRSGKSFIFSKCPKNVPESIQTWFEHVSRSCFW